MGNRDQRPLDDQPDRAIVRRARAAGGEVVNRRERPDRDPDLPQESDLRRFGDVTTTCPNCGEELYDDVSLCWNCGHAVLGGERPRKGLRAWAPLIAALVVAAFVLSFVLYLVL